MSEREREREREREGESESEIDEYSTQSGDPNAQKGTDQYIVPSSHPVTATQKEAHFQQLQLSSRLGNLWTFGGIIIPRKSKVSL